MQVLRYTLAALVIAGALAPAAAPAYTPEETTRLEALFQAAVDAGAGTELKDATVIAEGGIIVHGDAACEISKILNGDEVCAVTAILVPPQGLGIDSINYFPPAEIGHVDMAEWTDEVNQEIDVIWQSFVEGAVDQSKRLGMTVRPLGWALYPTLDKERGILRYGMHVDFGGQELINLVTIKFTREGFALMRVITDKTMMQESGRDFAQLAAYAADTYVPGTGLDYADYKIGDRVAEIGVLGVLASAMGVKYANKGWLAGIAAAALIFAKKLWFLVFAIPVALWAGVKKLFRRKGGS